MKLSFAEEYDNLKTTTLPNESDFPVDHVAAAQATIKELAKERDELGRLP